VLKLIPCVVAISALMFSVAASAPAAMIDFRPALIPQMGSPLPVALAVDPPIPTTADTIAFTAPLDGKVYSNDCYAASAFLGRPVLDIDEVNHVINIRFDGVFTEICPAIYDPVIGTWGEFGPLAAGDWALHNTHGGSLAFTVVPEPASGMLVGACAAGFLAWRRRHRM